MVYAVLFYIYKLVTINKNKTTFIMTHDESINSNIMRMYQQIKKERPDEVCKFITKKSFQSEKGWQRFIKQIVFVSTSSFHLATSQVIFLDNVFLPMAFMRFKKDVQIIQLWHGCNTLKKFGQLSNVGQLKWLEHKANSRYTAVIVSSNKMINLHQEAFGVKGEKILPLGIPRIDALFESEEKLQRDKESFYKVYPQLRHKKIILYAPTFRDNDLNMEDSRMNLNEVMEKLPKAYQIITKYHPFVAHRRVRTEDERIIDVSDYEDLNTLLLVADVLITDYSSIIYEYAVLNKPIIFYAYDKEEYESKIRGFYYNYDEYVPGKIVYDKEELLACLKTAMYKKCDYENFIEQYLDYKDNQSSKRIFDTIYKEYSYDKL